MNTQVAKTEGRSSGESGDCRQEAERMVKATRAGGGSCLSSFSPLSTVDIPDDHPAFTKGVPCPVPTLIGIPLLIFRDITEHPFKIERTASLDNQFATYCMIEPVSGFAPPEWQMNIGPVTVVRSDKKNLDDFAFEAVWLYLSYILDKFGDEAVNPKVDYTPVAFRRWFNQYRASMGNTKGWSGAECPLDQ